MSMSLEQLRRAGRAHLVEHSSEGFTILRRSEDEAPAFNALAREALGSSGQDFVAFPQPDGRTGYVGLFVIPLI
ncbi:MAG: hypothetical protein V7678_10835 [Brevundimonas sp.]